ncbi:MAG TPA: heavy metal-binding domain-containing protein [Trebonia sp.]|nr:heavy metal-binding domain-containing protein [Trebonia sp.]
MSNELPAAAEARMAEIRRTGTWGSALSSDEFAAIRSTGFEAVGQVLGAAVYNVGYTGGYGCPGAWGSYSLAWAPAAGTQVSSRGGYGSFGPMVETLYKARRTAIRRMVAECTELGGHGVVGVRLTIGPFPAGGLEFKAIGTAIRAPGAPPLKHPFTSDLNGQDFAKLVMKGWMPAGLALGISIAARHDDWRTVGQTRWGAGNAEVNGFTELVNDARHDARQQLAADVKRIGGEGVVVADMDLRVRERECPAQEGGRDHVAEATNIGTAIVRFSTRNERRGSSLAIMSLDPQRRQAARVNIGANRR